MPKHIIALKNGQVVNLREVVFNDGLPNELLEVTHAAPGVNGRSYEEHRYSSPVGLRFVFDADRNDGSNGVPVFVFTHNGLAEETVFGNRGVAGEDPDGNPITDTYGLATEPRAFMWNMRYPNGELDIAINDTIKAVFKENLFAFATDITMFGSAPTFTLTPDTTGDARIALGLGRGADGRATFDLVTDDATVDWDFRMRREAGPNGTFAMTHKGTGNWTYATQNNAAHVFSAFGSEQFRIQASGVIFNNGNRVASDFQMKSGTNNYAFFLDSSLDRIGIFKNNPQYPLDITGDLGVSGDIYLSNLSSIQFNGGSGDGEIIANNLYITGNLFVSGTTTQVDTEVSVADALINVNDGQAGPGMTVISAGMDIDRGTNDPYRFGYFESTDTFRVGIYYQTLNYTPIAGVFSVGEIVTGGTTNATGKIVSDNGATMKLRGANKSFTLGETLTGTTSGATATLDSQSTFDTTQPLATREEVPTDNGVAHWDAINYQFVASSDFTWDGFVLTVDGIIRPAGEIQGGILPGDTLYLRGTTDGSGSGYSGFVELGQDSFTIGCTSPAGGGYTYGSPSLWRAEWYSAGYDSLLDLTNTGLVFNYAGASVAESVQLLISDGSLLFTVDSVQKLSVDVNGIATQLGVSVNEFSTDITLGGNSDLALPTEKAVKTYIDTAIVPGTKVTQAAHGLAVGNVIYNNGTIWTKAKSDNANTLGMAVVSAVADVNNFSYVAHGYITITAHGFPVGQYIYTSAATAGLLTPTEPVGISQFSNPIAYVPDANTILVLPWRPTQALPRYNDSRIVTTALTTYNVTDLDDWVNSDATAGNVTVNLPTPSAAYNGFTVYIKKVDGTANTVTVKSATGTVEGLAGTAGFVIYAQYEGHVFGCDGTNWWIK